MADAEAGFGGPLNAFELMKGMIAAGAAAVHWEDQLASEKKCGHLGGKVLVPTAQHVRTLNAARLAADICDVPTLIVARTDSQAATLLTSDVDERDEPFVTGDRTAEGFYRVTNGIERCIARGLAYAPYADLLWMETSTPDLAIARQFAEAIKAEYPDQMLTYNCSPSFNWSATWTTTPSRSSSGSSARWATRSSSSRWPGSTPSTSRCSTWPTATPRRGMTAYVKLQDAEFAAEPHGYTATQHQREVGTGYFDMVTTAINPTSDTTALAGSTESEQFAVAH